MLFRYSTLAVATTLLATATALSPTDIPSDLPVSSLLTSAQDHLSKGETSEALIYYDAAVDRDSSNYLTLFKRGATYLSLGRANQAANDFNKVLALKPGFEGAHVQLAKLKAKTADWESARVQFAAANKGADSPDVIELEEAHSAATLAETAFNDSKWDDCVNHAGIAIMVASRSANLREMRAHCRSERNEPREAMSDLQHVLGLRPGDITPHVTISATSFYGLGDMENGMAQVRKCLQSDPDSKPCKKLHRKQKVISKAFGKVQGQLSRGQSTTAGRSLVGTEEDSGLISDIKEQIEELRQAGSILGQSRPKLYESVIELTCQAYSESNHKDTDKYCDEALEMNPESFWGLLRRGKKLLKQEDFEAAINTLKQAAEAHPQNQDKIHPVLQKAQIELKRSKTKDYYKVLGVQNDADEKQIKSAYRKASKQFHPDKAAKQGIAKEDAEKKMAAVNEAYEVLGDPELRARFDRGDDPNSQEPGSPFQGSPFGGRQPHFQFQQGGQRMKNGFPFGGGGGGGGFEGGFGGFGF